MMAITDTGTGKILAVLSSGIRKQKKAAPVLQIGLILLPPGKVKLRKFGPAGSYMHYRYR
jgi:hypothetical protein